MQRSSLHNPYPVIENDGTLSFGGNQAWSDSAVMRKCGCGVIGGTDLLLYLSLHKDICRTELFKEAYLENGFLELPEYMNYVNYFRRKYLPVIPHFGMAGWMLVLGLNRYFRHERIRLRAAFGVLPRNLWVRISAMLAHDIPVILLVGPNFPFVWGKHRLNMYYRSSEGEYSPSCQIKAHFVTVTGMDETWMRVSSWGKEYYINRQEYYNYVRKHSSFLISNICYIKSRK